MACVTALCAVAAEEPAAAAPASVVPSPAAEPIDLGPLERVKIEVLAQMMSDASGRPFAISGGLDTEFSVLVPDGDPVALDPGDI